MSVKFATVGSQVHVYDLDEDTFSDTLKPRVYTLEYSECSGFHLKIFKSRFDEPKTIYGSTNKKALKVVTTYNDRVESTGVLLTGNKGAGKTMLSEIIANRMIDDGKAVILIDKNFGGKSFLNFLNTVGECVLFFDEIGKNFATNSDRNNRGNEREQNNQDELLTMMDGTSSIKRLFLITENEKININKYMLDRPGRVYYHFKYGKLEEDVISEYSEANGIDKVMINEIIESSRKIKEFSFDILKCIVDEQKRYNESVSDTLKDLNVTFENTLFTMEVVELIDIKTSESLEFTTKTIDNYDGDNSYDFSCSYYATNKVAKSNDVLSDQEVNEILALCEDKELKNNPEVRNTNNAWFSIMNDIKYNSAERMVYENEHYRLVGRLKEKLPTYSSYGKVY